MQIKIFSLLASQPEPGLEELNKFLRTHSILALDKAFLDRGAESSWTFCVSYVAPTLVDVADKKPRVDYKLVLGDADFQVYAGLRELRKQVAAESAVPVYAVFTNEQLAEMVTSRVTSLSMLQQIDGVGEAKIKKYGQRFLAHLLNVYQTQQGRQPVPETGYAET